MSGREIYSGTIAAGKSTINTESWNAGTYIINIDNGHSVIIRKLIKE